MNRVRVPLIVVLLLAVGAAPASADFTAFIGANTSPANRLVKGFSIGAGLLLLGFEFEYASTSEGEDDLAPALRTGMGNVLLQTPFEIFGIQPYVTAGAGLYRERLDDDQDTFVGVNTGGGAKITLTGPLRVRVDYRIFRLGGDAVASPAHRFYAGFNLRF